ncbi:uncharacterized protein cubi_02727 [Cryptosporidium ubiquitum]|uniref:peptidylprolyl isomerase n=1 Tax=Cryptosporidium ubiquitum TaxID=857276 RepID=A0A1J4MM29_9CRYT|nr:uncharacterized protein cubi_02727 [Cryptosporidium ubiquitum]OII73925.1 hypothetical protein cubi_02727 [Cryptosporidium ubiquitum]
MSLVNKGQESESSDESQDFGPGFSELVEESISNGGQQFDCVESDHSKDQDELGHSSKMKKRKIEGTNINDGVKRVKEENDNDDDDDDDDDDDSLGPMPTMSTTVEFNEKVEIENKGIQEKKDRDKELEKVVNIPKTDFYECSFMHKKQVTHVVSSNRTGFAITASKDGVIKFWRLRSEKEILREKESLTKESSSSVITSLEFVKGFQAHRNEVSDISISNCEQYMASISEFENNIKLYSISYFDMISIIRIPIYPNRCVFLSSLRGGGRGMSCGSINYTRNKNNRSDSNINNINNTAKLSSGLIYPQIVVSELKTGSIYIYSIKGDNLIRSNEEDEGDESFLKYNNHKSQITCLRFLPNLGIVISADMTGGLEFWDPWTMALPKRSLPDCGLFNQIKFKFKIETDLFELQKNKCYAISMVVSSDERNLAIRSSDHKIRLFSIQTGKCLKVFDENISYYNIMQSNPEYDYLHIDRLEFGVRSAVETEIQNLPEYYDMQNMVFDETCRFLIYPSMIGICVLDIQIGRRVLIIGKFETGKRFLNLGLLQIHRGGISYNNQISHVDSVIISSAYKSNRIYIFSKRLPLLDNGDVNLKRDIFNELPSNEEIEKQKQLEKFLNKGKERSNAYIRIAKQVILHTTKGDITLELYPEIAPKACENFSVHCFNGYYNNCIFHRVIKGFMIQTGDPTGQGIGGVSIWGKEFEDEISPDIKHDEPFTLSMANAGPNTNGSQFFITTASCPWLDGVHTIFGKVIHGKEIVKEIEHVATNRNDKPIQDVLITSTSTIFN